MNFDANDHHCHAGRERAANKPAAGTAAIEALEAIGSRLDVAGRRNLARLYIRAERLADAEACYVSLLYTEKASAGLWVEAGRLADRMGAAELAEARLRRALNLPGGDRDEARAALAAALMHVGRFDAAGRQWWKLTRGSASSAGAGWAGLLICAQVAEHPRAVAWAEQGLTRCTVRSERQRMLAALWRDAAGPAAACSALADHRAEAASPKLLLAAMLRDAAHTLAHQALATPGRADVHFHHAVVEDALGDPVTARHAVARALTVNPRYAAAQVLKARLVPGCRAPGPRLRLAA